jgi:hypothetical protein
VVDNKFGQYEEIEEFDKTLRKVVIDKNNKGGIIDHGRQMSS